MALVDRRNSSDIQLRPIERSLISRVADVMSGDRWRNEKNEGERRYVWGRYEGVYGNVGGVVTRFEDMPEEIAEQVNALVAEQYDRRLFSPELMKAALMLIANTEVVQQGIPRESALELLESFDIQQELERARRYVTSRGPDDLIVVVMNGGDKVQGTMTLFEVPPGGRVPSAEYLEIHPSMIDKEAKAVEVGRFVALKKRSRRGGWGRTVTAFREGIYSLVAYVVAEGYLRSEGVIEGEGDVICGDTHGSLTDKLISEGIPVGQQGRGGIDRSDLSKDILEGPSRDVLSYFLTRVFFGKYTHQEILGLVEQMKKDEPELADEVTNLLQDGFRKQGIDFSKLDSDRFGVNFFTFPFNDPRTMHAFKVMRRKLSFVSRVDHLINGSH